MRLHEYQAKEAFADAGITVPDAQVATTPAEVVDAADAIGYPVAVKAQVHVGGRGKAGGIALVDDADAAAEAAERILGMDLKGYTVEAVLVEAGVDFTDELYVGVTMDRTAAQPVIMVSTEGGVDIEAVAEHSPDAIATAHIDPAFGLHPYQARRVVYEAGIDRAVAGAVIDIVERLYALFVANDATEVEINPVMITTDAAVIAADAVMNIDGDALFRQEALAALADEGAGDALEQQAAEAGFDYVRLDGNVGIIGNGAGLVMTTLDLVDHFGGTPANFLDIGGGARADRVTAALELVFSDDNVDAVVFNIFGGITRGDEVATGINEAVAQIGELPKPVIVRLAGTNASEGMAILDTDAVTVEATLEDAVQAAIAAAEAAA
ncbi:MAG: ADP-forming succinate--CoA ligase subunit beta [Haloferacaceae archaeon]|nr:ADP-forming succinate--CoA ligase subunit beta [Haloferacaceae archaeon]